MRRTSVPGVGGVLSADIAVPEHEREVAFYASILTTGTNPLWREDLMNNQGTPIIGLGVRTPEYDALPLQWMPHFQVADVAASAAAALELGGNEIMHGKADDGTSQWAVLTDPDGAAFGLIPAVPADAVPASDTDHVGCIAWLSLFVPDAAKSRNFYQGVVGWSARPSESTPGDAHNADVEMVRDDDLAVAEICSQRSLDADIPPVWLLHLPVDDLADSVQRASAAGGVVVNQADGFAIVRDPVGVYVGLCAG
ncbi:MAG: VOC family protein [Planctomycetota bacterium]